MICRNAFSAAALLRGHDHPFASSEAVSLDHHRLVNIMLLQVRTAAPYSLKTAKSAVWIPQRLIRMPLAQTCCSPRRAPGPARPEDLQALPAKAVRPAPPPAAPRDRLPLVGVDLLFKCNPDTARQYQRATDRCTRLAPRCRHCPAHSTTCSKTGSGPASRPGYAPGRLPRQLKPAPSLLSPSATASFSLRPETNA